ncbi:hypothetical protein [Portibacter marinus]|uniref:hypothetical protein n=1 Tax=Portibacter marinus TaxID=2898660 RepID=UPI001F2AA5F8|nr:hypothetical protein [Portibacter marinus]
MRLGIHSLFFTDVIEAKMRELAESSDLALEFFVRDFDPPLDLSLDAFCFPIHLISPQQKQESEIVLLLDIGQRSYSLLIHKDLKEVGKRLGLNPDVPIYHPSEFIGNRLYELNASITLRKSQTIKIIADLMDGVQSNFVIESFLVNDKISESYEVINLNEKEFGHAPGQGFIAVMINKDSTFRQMLRRLNSKGNIAISNIERKIAKMYGQPLNIHCELDMAGRYKVWAFTETAQVQVSQSTRHLLEDKVISKLKNN